MNSFSRRHLFGGAGVLVTMSALGAEAWAQAKDRLVIGMSLEPPLLDPTKNAAAAIREVTTPSIFESLGRIDRTGAVGPGLAETTVIGSLTIAEMQTSSAGTSPRTARNTSSSCARASDSMTASRSMPRW